MILALCYVSEYLSYCEWNDSDTFTVSLHRVRLTTRRLSVGENGTIDAAHATRYDILDLFLIQLLCCRILLEQCSTFELHLRRVFDTLDGAGLTRHRVGGGVEGEGGCIV